MVCAHMYVWFYNSDHFQIWTLHPIQFRCIQRTRAHSSHDLTDARRRRCAGHRAVPIPGRNGHTDQCSTCTIPSETAIGTAANHRLRTMDPLPPMSLRRPERQEAQTTTAKRHDKQRRCTPTGTDHCTVDVVLLLQHAHHTDQQDERVLCTSACGLPRTAHQLRVVLQGGRLCAHEHLTASTCTRQ